MSVPLWSRSLLAAALGVWPLIAGMALAQAQVEKQKDRAKEERGLDKTPAGGEDPLAEDPAGDAQVDGVFLPPDRTVKRRLDRARESLSERRFGEAVRYLGSLAESPEDYFFRPDPRQPVYRSLKSEAGKLISQMPRAGVDSYELLFGSRARRMLNDAIAKGDVEALGEVSRRFFYTTAGCEATLALGRNHLDESRPLAAALCFDRLRSFEGASQRYEPLLSIYLATSWARSGMPDRAEQVVEELRKKLPDAQLRIGGKDTRLFGPGSTSLAWVYENPAAAPAASGERPAQQWTIYRGDWTRNGQSSGGRPLLDHRWRQHTVDYPMVERVVAQLRQGYLDQDVPALPSLHPLAVNDVILMRTWRNLLAVNFKTGKRVWQAMPASEDPFEQLVSTGSGQQFSQSLLRAAQQRMWEDAAFGTLSSDGELVFAIEDLGIAPTDDFQQRTIFLPNGQRRATWPKTSNKLAAYELRTEGALKWEVGGEQGGSEPKLAGAFFLGPPLPLQGRLYALAETKGQEIRLVVLSAKTGGLEWSQQLAVVEQNIAQDPVRRLSGAMPSFADGVLVCPTSAGAVVAIDLTTRALLWGYQYPREQLDRIQSMQISVYPMVGRGEFQHWTDASTTLAQGHVVVTPVESDHLFCLNLLDGRLVWKQDRGSNLYAACVHQDKLVLVGHHEVSAVKLTTGDAAWPQALALPDGAMPSGRGFYSGSFYFLPLSIGEVIQIDLDRGTIVSRAHSRRGAVPGNLICFRNEVISQGVDYLETFYQLEPLKLEVAETLKRHPDEAKALARLGAIKLDEGDLKQAIALFKRSYAVTQDDYTRELLVDSILEALRTDFAHHRASAAEVERLVQRPEQRTAYLRLVAMGLKQQGEVPAAFAAFMRLAGEESELEHMDELDPSLSVRRDRWLHEQLHRLYLAASPQERAGIEQAVSAKLQAALAKKSDDALRQFIRLYDGLPASVEARESLVAALSGGHTLLEREMLLSALAASPDAERQRSAIARLAALYREAKRPDLAAVQLRLLLSRWPDVVVLSGKTARQIVDEVPKEDPLHAVLGQSKPWPAGAVQSQLGRGRTLAVGQRGRNVELQTRAAESPAFRDVSVIYDTQQQAVFGRDTLGIQRMRVSLSEQLARRTYGFGAFNNSGYPAANYYSATGNLMLLFMGNQVLAIDSLRAFEPASTSVLWSQDLTEQIPGMSVSRAVQTRPINVPWGPTRFAAFDDYGRPVGSVGPVRPDAAYLERFRDLLCVDPMTGETLWTRKNVPPGSDLFGDEELLFVAPPEGNEAMVLSAADGTLLGKRRVVSLEQRMMNFGRDMLTWELRSARPTLAMTDAWSGDTKWTYAFTPGTKLWLADQTCVGLLEPGGRFVAVSLPDGKLLVEDHVVPERTLGAIYLLPSRDHLVLITKMHPRGYDAAFNVHAVPGGVSLPVVSGRMYSYDRKTGQRAFRKPIRLEQYGLWLSQPSEVPILTFVRSVQMGWTGGRRPAAKTSVLCIDKRNGRTVFEKENVASAAQTTFEVVGDPAASTVTLAFPGKAVNFTLTDTPLQPEQQPRTGLGNIAEAILESFGSAILDLSERTQNLPADND